MIDDPKSGNLPPALPDAEQPGDTPSDVPPTGTEDEETEDAPRESD